VKIILEHIEWRRKRLQTQIAKKIGKYLAIKINKQKAKIIVAISAGLAFEGIITEKIAIALRKYLSKQENIKLREQLNLDYLRKFK